MGAGPRNEEHTTEDHPREDAPSPLAGGVPQGGEAVARVRARLKAHGGILAAKPIAGWDVLGPTAVNGQGCITHASPL